MAMDNEIAKDTNIDTLKQWLDNFREVTVNNFGSDLDYTFMKAEKKWSSNSNEATHPNTTTVLMQLSNKKEFGVLQVIFDDRSSKMSRNLFQ
jgi:hypothetical protein